MSTSYQNRKKARKAAKKGSVDDPVLHYRLEQELWEQMHYGSKAPGFTEVRFRNLFGVKK